MVFFSFRKHMGHGGKNHQTFLKEKIMLTKQERILLVFNRDFCLTNGKYFYMVDNVDIQFQKPVYPYCVNVYETYNAGCVRRIWAGDGQGNWKLFHENPIRKSLKQSHIFSPEPHHLPFLTR